MFGKSGHAERSGEVYLPYVGHIAQDVVLLRDGSVLAMGHVKGVPFELEEPAVRNGRKRNLNTVLRNIADDNVTVSTHMIRHPDVPDLPETDFRSDFARKMSNAYKERVLEGRLYRNDYFLTITVTPRNALGKMGSRLLRVGKGHASEGSEATVRQLEDVWQIVSSALDSYGVRRLGLRERNGVVFTEIGEALRLIISARWMPVPVVSGSLGASIYTDRVICGKRGVEIRSLDRSFVGGIFSFREYPARTRPGMLNALLSVEFPVVVSQSFGFLTRAQADDKLTLKSNQMASSGDKATSQLDQLADAVDKLISNEFVFGAHHFSLAVYADDLVQLGERSARARARLTDAGAVVVQEGIGQEAAFWSQLPGNWEFRTRPGSINSSNFAALSTFDNFPVGSRDGYWGTAIARFRTDGATPYDYVPHVKDVGMTAIFGPIGSGKTTFLMFVMAMMEQALSAVNGAVVFFDKDRGGQLLVLATGGTYLVLKRGVSCGLAPLRGLQGTADDIEFLRHWITGLIESDGKGAISSEDAKRLQRGIARQMSYPVEMRSLAGLRQFLLHGPEEGAGARLERWCRGGALGWLFDGETDEVDLSSSITGFDLTAFLDHDQICAPTAAYLLYRIEKVVDGRRFLMSCDEFRAYLLDPKFAAVIDKFLLTIRKNNGMLILATQQPEHVLESKLGSSLVAQCMTKILYPSPTADRHAYITGLSCTEGEYRAVREGMVGDPKRFLMKRENGSVICEFDLSSMPEYIAVLSGRANRANFAERLREEYGDNPSQWLDHFMARYHEAKD
ncbi:VirB4 family type IV secretion/conjugal transfer ATPase [Komagataeibacter rhaeticus]|jgi:type IV secretion system protein VirB4|uniref:VirB4 family type IV secretion/conjugal transfer ATPase n=1 Tax=Komagataeibacter rhaeticus TaxID=215221 RepID=UPI001A4DFDA2|nr:VirB4 family type IV secretion/conjugal transfer ATPase [Komagataeibacter rhaeticus]MBL7241271.1 VirB4 family type IV secretion/conjugal transfer ATPase [Komagataeibacter rhaeticus]